MPSLQSNGVHLHYETAGAGEPLLLLHGLGSRASDWQMQLPAFAARYRVIAPDLRGHGRSDKPPGPYTMRLMADDVAGLLAGLGTGPAHVVGLSMGGMIAFQLAVDRPELVRSLVIVNSAPALVPRNWRERLQVAQRMALARLLGPRQTGRYLSQRLFPRPEQAPLRAQLVDEWSGNDPDAYLASMRACVGWSVLDRVPAIACPVLVISGDRDYLPLDAKREYTALLPHARLLVFEDSGHATPIDQAERFNEAVLGFLSEQRPDGLYSASNRTNRERTE